MREEGGQAGRQGGREGGRGEEGERGNKRRRMKHHPSAVLWVDLSLTLAWL